MALLLIKSAVAWHRGAYRPPFYNRIPSPRGARWNPNQQDWFSRRDAAARFGLIPPHSPPYDDRYYYSDHRYDRTRYYPRGYYNGFSGQSGYNQYGSYNDAYERGYEAGRRHKREEEPAAEE